MKQILEELNPLKLFRNLPVKVVYHFGNDIRLDSHSANLENVEELLSEIGLPMYIVIQAGRIGKVENQWVADSSLGQTGHPAHWKPTNARGYYVIVGTRQGLKKGAIIFPKEQSFKQHETEITSLFQNYLNRIKQQPAYAN